MFLNFLIQIHWSFGNCCKMIELWGYRQPVHTKACSFTAICVPYCFASSPLSLSLSLSGVCVCVCVLFLFIFVGFFFSGGGGGEEFVSLVSPVRRWKVSMTFLMEENVFCCCSSCCGEVLLLQRHSSQGLAGRPLSRHAVSSPSTRLSPIGACASSSGSTRYWLSGAKIKRGVVAAWWQWRSAVSLYAPHEQGSAAGRRDLRLTHLSLTFWQTARASRAEVGREIHALSQFDLWRGPDTWIQRCSGIVD